MHRQALLLLVPLLVAACGSTPSAPAPQAESPRAVTARVGDDREVRVSDLTPEELAGFQEAWALFVARDPRWPQARDRWLARGGAAPYVLSENLFRYFWSASKARRRDEITRVGLEARAVGEPAVAYFAKPLVTESWPLKEPQTVKVFNPDNPREPLVKTFTHYDIDDVTRQHAAMVLAAIGPPAVPTLTSSAVEGSTVESARTYASYILGVIATDEAVASLGSKVRTGATWRERGAAAKGLGYALRRNEKARPHLEAALQDADRFVREKAQEGLEGRTRPEF